MSEEFEPIGAEARDGDAVPGESPKLRRARMVAQLIAIAEVCVALILAFVLTLAVSLPLIALFGFDLQDPAAFIALSLPIQAVVFAGMAWLLSHGRIPPEVLPRRGSLIFAIGVGIAVGIGAYPVEFAILWLLELAGFTSREQAWVGLLLEDTGAWLRTLPLIVVVGPVAEEIFFRGYAFRRLLARVNVPVAYLLSSLLFALMHMNPSGIPAYTVLALIVAWSYRRTGSLWTPVIAHVVHNAIVAITYSYLGVDG